MSNAEASSKKATALLLPKLLQVGMAIPRLFVVFLGEWRNRAMKTFSSFENMRNHNLFPGNVGIERNRMFSLENSNTHAITNIIQSLTIAIVFELIYYTNGHGHAS